MVFQLRFCSLFIAILGLFSVNLQANHRWVSNEIGFELKRNKLVNIELFGEEHETVKGHGLFIFLHFLESFFPGISVSHVAEVLENFFEKFVLL